MELEQVLVQLSELERSIYEPEVRADAARLSALLHEDFGEIGRSGRFYTREALLEELPRQPMGGRVVAQDFALSLIANGVALLTYRTVEAEAQGGRGRDTLRSSLWLQTAQGWRLRFHQGTTSASSMIDSKAV